MTEALTYTSLVEDVIAYSEQNSAEFLAQIPRFIMMAENRLSLEYKGLGNIKVVNFELTEGSYIIEKPENWRETVHIVITSANGKKTLKNRGVEYIQTYWPDPSIKDVPEFYADYNYDHFYIGPTPNQTYNSVLSYYQKPEHLSDSNQTNWITRNVPQALLYATLLEAQPFLKRSDRIQEFQNLYDRAIGILSDEDERRSTDRSQIRK